MKSNKWTYKVSAFLLACILLISSTGFSYNVHVCQGEIQSFSFFGAAPVCKNAEKHQKIKNKKSCCALKKEAGQLKKLNGKEVISSTPCCSNKQLFYHTDSEFESSTEAMEVFKIDVINVILSSFIDSYSFNNCSELSFDVHAPPLIEQNFSVLYQVFRL